MVGAQSAWMVGVDTGGTFTDLVAVEEVSRELRFAKVPSVPSDPSQAVLNALEDIFAGGVKPEQISLFVHGTTVATNALVEGKGVKTGLLITRGFRAVYEARGWALPDAADLIDPFYRKPPMLAPQHLTAEITERVDYQGEVVTPLDETDIRAAIRHLRKQGIESLAICFLFSFLNPTHELRAAEIVAQEAPQWRVSVSSLVLPVLREYTRLSTSVVDAYVGPLVETYLLRLAERIKTRGLVTRQLFIMQSNGGLMRITSGARHPNQMLLSGPAAGVIAAGELARISGISHAVTFDMGGTSADIGVIVDGRMGETTGGRLAGQDIGNPMLKLRTLGAGGGTIAWIGKDGLLKVGPHSAGAVPGPACYGRGGEDPTVTDANLVLGALDGKTALAGRLRLDASRARQAIEAKLGRVLGLDLLDAASGIIRIVNTNMAVDLRLALQEEGQDPRRFALIAFGGAGPLHAAEIARAVRIPQVLVPSRPGINCAMGLLQTAVRHTYLRSAIGALSRFPVAEINALFARLASEAYADAESEGFARSDVALRHQVEMRYLHQGYQLLVDCPIPFTEDARAKLKRDFDALHRQTYGQSAEAEEAELVTFRLQAEIPIPRLELAEAAPGDGRVERALKEERPLFDLTRGAFAPAKVYDRARLAPGDRIAGPAIIDQFDATTVLLEGQSLTVDRFGTLVIATGIAP